MKLYVSCGQAKNEKKEKKKKKKSTNCYLNLLFPNILRVLALLYSQALIF